MNIGRLRDRITIQTLKQTRNITGEILETWVDGHTLWASVNMISSKEAISSGAELATGTVRIWIRYRKDINATSRIKVNTGPLAGRVLNIIGQPLPDAARTRLEILCREGAEK
ncbi:phage head closure protein [Escherichia coli]|nr:phage head closure protein [Escherichia coli]